MLTIVNPRTYDFIDPDDDLVESILPVDQWLCSDCGIPIGWVIRERESERPIIFWREIWIEDGTDLFGSSTERLCETCREERTA